MAEPVISSTTSFAIGGILLTCTGLAAVGCFCLKYPQEDVEPIINLLTNFAVHFFYLGGFLIDATITLDVLMVSWAILMVLLQIPEWRWALSTPEIPRTVTTRDVYESLKVKTLQAVIMGLGQTTLLVYFIWGIYTTAPPTFTTYKELAFYFSGEVVLLSYAIGKGGDLRFDKPAQMIWFMLASKRGMACSYYSEGEEKVIQLQERKCSLILRYLLNTIVNDYGCAILRCVVPLQLATSANPIEFVLNAVAATVILELDDQPDVEYTFVKQQQVGQISLPLVPGAVKWKSKWSGTERSTEDFVPQEEPVSLVIDVEKPGTSNVLQTKSMRILCKGDPTESTDRVGYEGAVDGDAENLLGSKSIT